MIELASFDLFSLLVSYIFGSIALAILGWALLMLLAGIMGRMSFSSILTIIITFLGVSSIAYIGSLGAIPVFLWACWFASTGVINKLNEAH